MATWTVQSMETAPQEGGLQDVVKVVSWVCTDTDGANEVRYGGNTAMPEPQVPFTPYDQLTEAQVIGWVQDVLGPDAVAAIEANLAEQLTSIANPPIVVLPLPWAA